MTSQFISGIKDVIDQYDAFIIDLWGVIHNGKKPYPCALETLRNLKELKNFHGIIIPGGFGKRGVEGKIKAINFVRKNNIPFLGLCYGMQLATIEFARNVCNLPDAHTTEINPKTSKPVICTMAEQVIKIKEKNMGGSMRLGAFDCKLHPNSLSGKLYGTEKISERHRHRYEVNQKFIHEIEAGGLVISGTSPDGRLVEYIEAPKRRIF